MAFYVSQLRDIYAAPDDVFGAFQCRALLAEQWRRLRREQEMRSADAIFKLKIIGALVGFGILAAMVAG